MIMLSICLSSLAAFLAGAAFIHYLCLCCPAALSAASSIHTLPILPCSIDCCILLLSTVSIMSMVLHNYDYMSCAAIAALSSRPIKCGHYTSLCSIQCCDLHTFPSIYNRMYYIGWEICANHSIECCPPLANWVLRVSSLSQHPMLQFAHISQHI